MSKHRHYVTFLISLFICFQLSATLIPSKNSNLKNLSTGWELFLQKTPEQTFALVDSNFPADYTVTVPHEWNKEVFHFGIKQPETYGCYRYVCKNLNPDLTYALHTKESPGTACAVYVNRTIIANAGDPFSISTPYYTQNPYKYGTSHSKCVPLYCEFKPDQNGNAEILFFVANYYYRKGGLWDRVYLGQAKDVWHYNILTMVFYCIVIGSLIFVGLLNMVQFILNKKRSEYCFLGVASLAFALRIATAGYCSLGIFFPELTGELKIKLELVATWLVPISVIQLIFLIYPSKNRTVIFSFLKEKYLRYSLITIDFILGVLSLILPAWFTNRFTPYFQILLIIFSLYVIIFCISNLIKRQRYSLYNFLSFLTIAIGGFIDIIHQKSKEIIPIPTLPFFILAFVIIQIIMLAAIQNDIYKETIKGTNDLKILNEAYLRFVPKEFLQLLNKDSIIKTKLGDYSNIEMTIMFSKVQIQCAQADVSLQENFSIFNDYLKVISPIIKKYDGFVSKFLSGGFMALFPKSQLDAIRTALEINDKIKLFNASEESKNYTITAWMGIHFGLMIIGTIGEENRLDDTVISDTVNTASRIESVCESLNKNIIISEAVHKKLLAERLNNLQINALEAIFVKGKEKPLQLYEITRKKQNESTKEENPE